MTTVTAYPKLLDLMVNAGIDWDADTIKVALLDDTYVYSDAHDFFDDVSAFEVTGTGYSAGGATLGTKTSTYASPWRILDAANPTWAASTIDAQFAVIYKSTGTPSTSPLLMVIDAEQIVSSNASTFSVPFDTDGVIRVGQSS